MEETGRYLRRVNPSPEGWISGDTSSRREVRRRVRTSCRQLASAGGEPRKNPILIHINRTIPNTPRGRRSAPARAALALPLARGVP